MIKQIRPIVLLNSSIIGIFRKEFRESLANMIVWNTVEVQVMSLIERTM